MQQRWEPSDVWAQASDGRLTQWTTREGWFDGGDEKGTSGSNAGQMSERFKGPILCGEVLVVP